MEGMGEERCIKTYPASSAVLFKCLCFLATFFRGCFLIFEGIKDAISIQTLEVLVPRVPTHDAFRAIWGHVGFIL
jgi:hypothetical protein